MNVPARVMNPAQVVPVSSGRTSRPAQQVRQRVRHKGKPTTARLITSRPDVQSSRMAEGGVFRRVDAVTVPVPDLEAGLRFYGEALGHRLKWRNDAVGQAGLELPDGDS